MTALALPGMRGSELARSLGGPLLIVMVLAMMILPLPPFVLDLLFTFNIAFAVMVLLTGMYTLKPLDFAIFPTVLLVTTLLRLSLNVASTRVVLLEGHAGPGAAGKVIESFGHFVVGDSYAVGVVVFVILVVINFVVITKGAGRIAEVGARFTLDALPGKQMAIDADLNAGLIGEDEARKRRVLVTQEADFYGAMDGASKFVRGDAIAGILIMVINLIGGLVIGAFQHGMPIAAAAKNYALLAIGDGLVAQIPALIISTAAGLVVSRVGTEENMGEQIATQIFARPQAYAITAGIIGALGLVPGMPHLAFIALAGLLGAGAYYLSKKQQAATGTEVAPVAPTPAAESTEVGWQDVVPVDVLGLEVGYRLVPLVDRGQDGELLRRIKAIRKKFAQDIGFLPPPIHIRDNLELRPAAYRVLLKGVEIAHCEAHAGMYLAINPGRVATDIPGIATTDPAFGLPAVWIEQSARDVAQNAGYTVVDASTVVATHLSQIMNAHASELFGREPLQQLLEHLTREAPKLTEDLVPKLLPMPVLQRVLQNLLEEQVHIRDMRSIVEALSAHAVRTQDPIELTAHVRVALGRAIVQQMFPGSSEVQAMVLDPAIERLLMQATTSDTAVIEPQLAEQLVAAARMAADRQEQFGLPALLLVPAPLRVLLSRFLRRAIPQLKVMSHAEVPDTRAIKVVSIVGGES
jgi:flagellar biosynthesis protein FlhA